MTEERPGTESSPDDRVKTIWESLILDHPALVLCAFGGCFVVVLLRKLMGA